MLKNILSFAIVLWALTGFTQNIEFTKENFKDRKDALKEAKRQIEEGDELMKRGKDSYKLALDPYIEAHTFNPNNALLNFKIGKCYLHSSEKLKAIPYLEKAFTLSPNVDPEIQYHLGRAYHLNLEFDRAILNFETYFALINPDAEGGEELRIDVDKKINECKVGKELVQKTVSVFIDNVGKEINSVYPDFSPFINADETMMIFTSRRNTTTGGRKDEFQNEYFEDIYMSQKKEGKWTSAVNVGSPVNTDGHDAAANLSADGQTMFIYKDENGGDLYISNLIGDAWTKPERLSKNINSSAHESSATLSSDGNTIYFVSDRPGGLGGRDIYFSKKDKKGKWSEAVNIGPALNTKYNEEGVFMHPDGKTLYFSSEGHKTMGGLDVFKSVLNNGQWSTPENLGYPINTPDADVFFVLSASGRYGYYSSANNKGGFGEKDIYMITFLGPEKKFILSTEEQLLAQNTELVKAAPPIAAKVEVKETQLTLLKGIISDALSQKPIEANIELVDNQKNEVIATFTSNSKSGKYLVSLPAGKNYGIAVKAEGYLFHSENFDIPTSAGYQEIIKDIALKNVSVGSTIVLKNIFFDFDKATLRSESFAELDRLVKLLEDVPTLKIEISGHTDNKGSAEYNQKLSENRSKAVVDYLINKGIFPGRLQFKGYGMQQPVATNDNEEGRQANRRTEFKILSK